MNEYATAPHCNNEYLLAQTNAIIQIMLKLIDVMQAENEQLMTPHVKKLEELFQVKNNLLIEYEAVAKELKNNQAFLQTLPEQKLEELTNIATKYNQVLELNQRRLSLTMRTLHSIIDSIAKKARKMSGHITSYGKKRNAYNTNMQTVSIALDENC